MAGQPRKAPILTGDALKAVESRGSPMQIIACAGSGKTEVVSQRVASLIESGIDPGKTSRSHLQGRPQRRSDAQHAGNLASTCSQPHPQTAGPKKTTTDEKRTYTVNEIVPNQTQSTPLKSESVATTT